MAGETNGPKEHVMTKKPCCSSEIWNAVSRICPVILIVCFIGASSSATEEIVEEVTTTEAPTSPYVGNLKQRLTLTGDWGGSRGRLYDKGVSLEMNLVNTFQSVVDGGVDTGSAFGGSLDLIVNLDFEKLRGWQGASLQLKGEAQFGNSVNSDTGMFLSPNVDSLFPIADQDKVTLTSVAFTKFFSQRFGMVFGKLHSQGGDMNVFAHGLNNNTFMNMAFGSNPITILTAPYSAWAFGFIVVPKPNIHLNLMVWDSEGAPDEWGFDTVFDGGTSITSELRIDTHLGGKPGHHLFGGGINSKKFTSVNQDPRLLLPPPSGGVLATERNNWSLYYNFYQFLRVESDDPTQGWGIFGRIGFADKITSPIQRFYNFGFGGKGIIPGRDDDTFGAGFYYADDSDKLSPIYSNIMQLDAGYGFEFFYNVQVTPWFHLTPDIQVIEPASGLLDTVLVVGLRSKIEF